MPPKIRLLPPPTETSVPTLPPTETATETVLPTLTVTPFPTETLTPLPVPTSTETATLILPPTTTETPTLQPSESVTAEVTTDASISPSPSASATPSMTATAPLSTATNTALPPEPELERIVSSDFSVEDIGLWDVGTGWSVVFADGEGVFQLLNSAETATFASGNLLNVAVDVRYQIHMGGLRLSVRQSAAGSYTVVTDTGGLLRLYRGNQEMANAFVGAAQNGEWRSLKLSAIENTIRVFLNGVEIIALADANSLPNGDITMAGEGMSTFSIGDYGVWRTRAEIIEAETQSTFNRPSGAFSVQSLNDEKIVFVSNRDVNKDMEIFSLDPSACNVGSDCPATPITTNVVTDQYPDLSSDGSKIAYVSYVGGSPELFIMNADGTNQQRLTYNSDDERNPVWSPDGSKLAFVSNRYSDDDLNQKDDNDWDIYILNLSACQVGQDCPANNITPNIYIDIEPDWYGSKIVFASNTSQNSLVTTIWVMNEDGTNRQQVTSSSAGHSAPQWSSDGVWITFTAIIGNRQIAKVNYAQCTFPCSLTVLTTDPERDEEPSWSPDNAQIVFQSESGSSKRLFMMNADGTSQVRITYSGTRNEQPSWGGGSLPDPTATPTATLTVTPTPTATPTPEPFVTNTHIPTNTATLEPFATNTLLPTDTPSIWYVTCSNLTGPLNIRENYTGSSQLLGEVGEGSQVVRPNLQEFTDNNIVRVQIFWPLGQAQTIGYVAIRDTQLSDGEYLTLQRDQMCPIPSSTPTPSMTPTVTATFNPMFPVYNPGRFDDNITGIESIFSIQSPSVMGSYGIHDVGQIDLVPKDSEYCIDSSIGNQLGNCDPAFSSLGMPVYAPVPGCAWRTPNNIVIFILTCEGSTAYPEGRREIAFTHLDPSTIQGITEVGNGGPTPLSKGQLIGNMCRDVNKDSCAISGTTPTHVAVSIRLYIYTNEAIFTPATNEEVLGFNAVPSCLFDEWLFSPGLPTSTSSSNSLHACP